MPASTLTPFEQPPQTTNESGQDAQARAVVQSAGNNTAARTQTLAQQLSSTGRTISGPGTYTVTDGGGTVTIGPGSTLTLENGSSFVVASGGQVIVEGGSTLTVESAGEVLVLPGGTLTVGSSSALTLEGGGSLTAAQASINIVSSIVTIVSNSSLDTLGVGNIVINGGVVESGFGGIGGPVAISAAVIPTPVVSGGSGAVSALGGAGLPGLAGTAGIQPQLNADLLLQWAQSVSGADLAGADLAGAAG
ncbi:hypothetical protein [Mycobacterium sp. Aquia_216]|uniref:hypothetical protein n=1 Tax=Mycobacterium sp. Aquia_216 TaxID=2991729 RepID=UPI002DD68274|nr:hypothetical protein [Mycobacterium sp. Aquia_216]